MDIGAIVRRVAQDVAPTVAGAVIGPGRVAAVRDIAGAVLGNRDADEESVARALDGMEPAERAKVMASLEGEYTARLKLASDDRGSAREHRRLTNDRTPMFIAFIDTGLLVLFVGALLFWTPNEESFVRDLMLMIGGALIKQVAQSRDFFLGSSAGSKEKTDILGRQRR